MENSYFELTKSHPQAISTTIETLYIGSPIDQAVGAVESLEQLADAVLKGDDGITIFNPLTAYNNAMNAESITQLNFVRHINEFVIGKAQAAAFAWRAQPSFGVPIEIDYFARSGKPFFVCNLSDKKLGLYLRSAIAERFGFVAESLDELSELIESFNQLSRAGAFTNLGLTAVKQKVIDHANGMRSESEYE